MMMVYFPLRDALQHDFDLIEGALTKRSEQIKAKNDSQGLLKKIARVALHVFGLMAAVVSLACIPATIFVFSGTLPTLGAISFVLSITCLVLHKLLTPRSDGEQIISNQWKTVFEALREGKGRRILDTCQELAKQKEKRQLDFARCIQPLPPDETTPFLQKICVIGYLLIAVHHLREGKEDQAKSHAYMALSHFGDSGFSKEIERFLQEVAGSPASIRKLIGTYKGGEDVFSLDRLVATKIQGDLENRRG